MINLEDKPKTEIDQIKEIVLDYIKKNGPDCKICYVSPSVSNNNTEDYKKEYEAFKEEFTFFCKSHHIQKAIKELMKEKKIWMRKKSGEGKYNFYNLTENPEEILDVIDAAKEVVFQSQERLLKDFEYFVINWNGNGKAREVNSLREKIGELEQKIAALEAQAGRLDGFSRLIDSYFGGDAARAYNTFEAMVKFNMAMNGK